MEEDGLVLDLSNTLTQQEEATQGPQDNAFNIEGSSWYFKDGDTLGNTETGEDIRFRGIDTRETAKFLEDSGFQGGELGGDAATAYLWSLANKHGFNQVVKTGEKGKFDRDIGDLQNAAGESFVDTLLKTGVAKLSAFSDGEDFQNVIGGLAARDMDSSKGHISDYEEARQAIFEVETEQYGGLPINKLMAFDAQEYEQNPDIYMGIKTLTKGSDYKGRSRTPFGTGFDVGFANLYKGLNTVGQALSDRFGMEETEASFAADAFNNQRYINAQPLVKMDVTEIDWTSFDEVTDGMLGMLGTSLPFMGATITGMAAAPFTYGASMSVPIAMYTGLVLDTMEGDIEDKNFSVALVAGTAMTFLDRLGLKGLVSPKMMMTPAGRQKAIDLIAANQFGSLPKSEGQALASQLLLRTSKKDLVTLLGTDGPAFAANQMMKGNLFREGVKRLTRATGQEGTTEALQELTEYTAAVIGSEKEWDYDEIENRMTNAIVAGGLMGASFAAPGTVGQALDWNAAADFVNKKDNRFDNMHSHIASAAEAANGGYIPSLDAITARNQAEEEAYQAEDANKRGAPPVDINESADAHVGPKTTIEAVQAFVKNPMVALRGVMDHTVRKMNGLSVTAVEVADMLGSTRQRIFGGRNMITQQQLSIAEYDSMGRENEVIENSFNTPRGLSSAKRSAYVSGLVTNFYNEVVKPATDSNTPFDWSKASEETKSHKEALLLFHKEITEYSNKMLNDNNETKANSSEKLINKLDNWGYRHKKIMEETVAKNKDEFIRTLMASYTMNLTEATALTNAIIDDPTVSTIGDAFEVTRGGLNPAMVKERKLNMSDRPEFDKFLEQNIFKNMSDAARESARFQAQRKFIGKDSKYLSRMLGKVHQELLDSGMNPVEAQKKLNEFAFDIRNIVNAESGNYKRMDNQFLKQVQKYLTLLTGLQALSNAAISSIGELGMVPLGVPREVMVKNAASQGYLFGNAVGAWIRNLAVTSRLAKPREDTMSFFEKRLKELRGKNSNDPRHLFYDNMRQFLRETGFMSQETGAATTTGVQETNELTKAVGDAFFKANFLHDQQDMHRMMRLTFFNDFLIGKLDLIAANEGQPDTVGVDEAKIMLRELGVPLGVILPLSKKMSTSKPLTDAESLQYKREFLNGAANFVNAAIPLPNALNRPLFYSDPHLALLTQFNGFTSTFTANQLPAMWEQVRHGRGSKGLTYSTFASASTMLALAFVSQGIKDELKYGESSPYLTDAQKIQRAIYSSGLLGTTERVISSNFLFPLYGDNSNGPGEFIWDNIAGEAAAASTVGRAYGMISGALESDSDKVQKNFLGSLPFLAPYKQQVQEQLDEWN